VLNFINPPLPKLEALEQHWNDRFAIPQLRSMLDEFRLIARSTGDLMHCRELVNLLFSKIKNSAHFKGFGSAVPETWAGFGHAEINQLMRNIDSKNTGYVNWRTLLTYMILLRSNVPSAKEISRIEKMLGEEATCEQFCQGSFWFDACEVSADRDNAIDFERVKMIKQMLFETHCQDGDDKL